jgi:hypothetical protein
VLRMRTYFSPFTEIITSVCIVLFYLYLLQEVCKLIQKNINTTNNVEVVFLLSYFHTAFICPLNLYKITWAKWKAPVSLFKVHSVVCCPRDLTFADSCIQSTHIEFGLCTVDFLLLSCSLSKWKM